MIEVQNLFARGDRGIVLRNVSLSWSRGIFAITGGVQDGTSLLLAVLAGRASAAGRVAIHGRPPRATPSRIAHVPLDTLLPDSLRVEEICTLAASVRKEPQRPALERLAPLGVEALAKRRGGTLSQAEARAVALSLALTSSADVLLVEEPFAHLDFVAPSRVAEALRARVNAGATAIITTASVRDATRIGDRVDVLTQGVLAPVAPVVAHASEHGTVMRIGVREREAASALVAALSKNAAVGSVDVGAYANSPTLVVLVSGPDLVALANAVTQAVAEVNAPVEAIEPLVMPLDAIRATLSRPVAPPPPPPTPPPPPLAPNTEPMLPEVPG